MNLNDRALLVQLNISQWAARKLDKNATKQVARDNNASTAAGRYNKSLLPLNDLLDVVHKKSTAIRQKYYDNTLPWGLDGAQMLPTANYLAFMTEFRTEKAEWETLVNDFLRDYSYIMHDPDTRLKPLLGSLYNPADYPSPSEVAGKFKMDLVVMPVPTDDFRVSIASDELDRIREDVKRRVVDASAAAAQEAWQRLYDRVKHIVEKLSDPKAIFRDSLVENAREICQILPRLNFNDDPHLETMRQEVEMSLLHHPDALRNNPALRRDTAAQAKAIMDKMSVFMGAPA
jgi:hypothetical protein